jgi:hypothetical protein
MGLLVMLIGFYLVPPPPDRSSVIASLTDLGQHWYHPERDIPVYVVGCLLGIALPVVLLQKGFGERRHGSRDQSPESLRALSTFMICVSVVMIVLLLLIMPIAVLPVLLTEGLLFFAVHHFLTIRGDVPKDTSRTVDPLSKQQHVVWPPNVSVGTPFLVVWDATWLTIMGLLIVALLAIPDISLLSGAIFSKDRYHHWEFFAMGPALQVRAGRALGSGAYSQYGLVFPLFLSGIDPIVPLRFDNLLRWSIGFGCIYFTGLALLLRVLLRDRLWAAIGTVVAVNLQCFTGTGNDVIWLHPSSSILRYGLDVWFFLALCLHVRTQNRAWMAVCGVVNGLAILWEMDTGIYLLGVSVLYSIATAIQPRHDPCDDTPGSRIWPSSIMLFGTTALVVFGGWFLVNRGVIDGQFLYGLFESILTFSSGMGCVPMSSLEWVYMLAFLAVTGTYLWPIARWLLGLRTRILPAGNDLLRFCLGSYGLGTLMLFVQRSHPFNLSHAIVPFCILTTETLMMATFWVSRWSVRPSVCLRAFSTFALCAALAALPLNTAVRAYPGTIQAALRGGPDSSGLSLGMGVGVFRLPPNMAQTVQDFRDVTSRLAELQTAGHRVAILDQHEPTYCLASGVPPCDRYCPLLPNLIFRDQLKQALERFEKEQFDYVMMDDMNTIEMFISDAKCMFHCSLLRDYLPAEQFGQHQIWKRRSRMDGMGASLHQSTGSFLSRQGWP